MPVPGYVSPKMGDLEPSRVRVDPGPGRSLHVAAVSSPRRAALAPWGLLLAACVLVLPLASKPLYGTAVAALVLAVVGARRSIAYPLGLAGFAAPIVAIAGHDPFPPRAVPILIFLWLVVALAFSSSE